jgi:hypothetical protein
MHKRGAALRPWHTRTSGTCPKCGGTGTRERLQVAALRTLSWDIGPTGGCGGAAHPPPEQAAGRASIPQPANPGHPASCPGQRCTEEDSALPRWTTPDTSAASGQITRICAHHQPGAPHSSDRAEHFGGCMRPAQLQTWITQREPRYTGTAHSSSSLRPSQGEAADWGANDRVRHHGQVMPQNTSDGGIIDLRDPDDDDTGTGRPTPESDGP